MEDTPLQRLSDDEQAETPHRPRKSEFGDPRKALEALETLKRIQAHFRGETDVARILATQAMKGSKGNVIAATVARSLNSFFRRLTEVVLDHKVIVITVVFLLLVGFGMSALFALEYEDDGNELWVPIDMAGYKDAKRLTRTFPKFARSSAVIYHQSGADILTTGFLLQLLRYHRRVETEAEWLKYCFRANATLGCSAPTNVLAAWNYDEQAIRADGNPKKSLSAYLNTNGASEKFKDSLSAVWSAPDAQGVSLLQAVTAHKATYPYSGEDDVNGAVNSLDDVFVGLFKDQWPREETQVRAHPRTKTSLSKEIARVVKQDVALVGISIVLVLLFCAVILGDRTIVGSRLLLGSAGIVGMIVAFVIGLGMLPVMGEKQTPITALVLFVLIGIGVDDIIIIVDSVNHHSFVTAIRRRLVRAVAVAGPAITLTTLTDVLAFALGSLATMPAVRSFTLTALVVLLADFALQVTVFLVCLELDERRIRQARLDCCVCITVDNPDATVVDVWRSACGKEEDDGQGNPELISTACTVPLPLLPPSQRTEAPPVLTMESGDEPAGVVVVAPAPMESSTNSNSGASLSRDTSTLSCFAVTPLKIAPPQQQGPKRRKSSLHAVGLKGLSVETAPTLAKRKSFVTGKTLDVSTLKRCIEPVPCTDSSVATDPLASVEALNTSGHAATTGPGSESEGLADRLLKKYWTPVVTHRVGKWIIIAVFMAWAVLCCYFIPKVGQGQDLTSALPLDSYQRDYFDSADRFFGGVPSDMFVVFDDPWIPWNTSSTLEAMDVLRMNMEREESVSAFNTWLHQYHAWVNTRVRRSGFDDDIRRKMMDPFGNMWELLPLFWEEHPVARRVVVLANENDPSSIVRSLASGSQRVQKSTDGKSADMAASRRVVSEWGQSTGVDCYVTTTWYGFADGDRTVHITIRMNLLYSGIAVLAALLLFVSPYIAIMIVFNVGMIDLSVFGWMYMLGINQSSVSYIVIAMSIGLSVDYCAHVGIAFANCRVNKRSVSRVSLGGVRAGESAAYYTRIALEEIGVSVFAGGMTTLLGICALAGARSETFVTFFLMLFAAVIFGMLHGFVFFPAMLSCLPAWLVDRTVVEPF
eukprot:TRINITY_DN15802_c0_g1_i1.p1 TRINITY_DN15802_c0_g1~~TRINITY_DN15802_c0_g1_i1.p1  ORF type:complete len:1112 (+),score=254.07 TRINITY_DN15802_c0_g1_i1:45-3338(+)